MRDQKYMIHMRVIVELQMPMLGLGRKSGWRNLGERPPGFPPKQRDHSYVFPKQQNLIEFVCKEDIIFTNEHAWPGRKTCRKKTGGGGGGRGPSASPSKQHEHTYLFTCVTIN